MKNFKMVLSYDGTRYNGWQKQGNTNNTIQEKIESVLQQIAGHTVEIAGSGRTDAGTHALGQVANFHMDWKNSDKNLMEQINEKLPEDIAVLSLKKVDARFHSRLSATGKTYEYTIWNSKKPPVFCRKYAFWVKEELDLEKMKVAARAFVGEHDFKSFCANKRLKKSSVRTISDITLTQEDDKIVISFTGNGFLYQMVRIIVGTLIEVGEGNRRAESIGNTINALDREHAGFTAPAKGLLLKEVYYGD